MAIFEKNDLNQIAAAPDGGQVVVLSLTDLSDYQALLLQILSRAKASGIPVVRFRFVPDEGDAPQQPAAVPQEGTQDADGITTVAVPLNHRFRHFTVAVHRAISSRQEGTLFLFDCLSDLQTAWATDLMMVNFFRVTTPLLKSRSSTAVFPLKAGMHSDTAARMISETADVFLDVCSDFKNVYVRAEKINGQNAPELFQPHLVDPQTGRFVLISDGVKLSRYHRAQDMTRRMHPDLSMDSWDRFFLDTQRKYEYGEDLTAECTQMCRIMMSRDLRMRSLILENFRPEDYFFVKEHMVGSGQIGGKSCGMLTARKIIENRRPELYDYMEAHDSFYIGSDVYSGYLVENGLWELSVRQNTEEEYFELSGELRQKILEGVFWDEIEQQFLHLLDYYGQAPIIVRSSSILEDGFDNAFAGKYDSVFVPNVGTVRERLAAFEDAVRTVYASTMSLSALDYRRRRGLGRRDEQMAVLVMRVSGSHFGNYFMPCAAGVGYSYSPYRFLPALDPKAGMLRLVMGLGTSAVDRTEGAYPRLVSLDQPQATPYHSAAERHRYSQRKISLIDKTSGSFRYVSPEEISGSLPGWLKRILMEHDTDAERVFRERGDRRSIEFVSCRGITQKQELMDLMRGMMQQLQASYGQSVDIEFTINLSEDGDYVVNLLQCRPLLVMQDAAAQDASASGGGHASPAASAADGGQEEAGNDAAEDSAILLETLRSSMGMSRSGHIDGIVLIDPVAYYELPYKDKPRIARAVGQLNWHFREAGLSLVLLTPGRIGTSSPELGVPTAFSDISSFSVICELAESRAGYQPELSYGSHIFQDLVEADILYDAVFEDERRVQFRPELLKKLPNRIREIVPDADETVITFCDTRDLDCRILHDMKKERLVLSLSVK